MNKLMRSMLNLQSHHGLGGCQRGGCEQHQQGQLKMGCEENPKWCCAVYIADEKKGNEASRAERKSPTCEEVGNVKYSLVLAALLLGLGLAGHRLDEGAISLRLA